MEGATAILDRPVQLSSQDLSGGVVWHFQILQDRQQWSLQSVPLAGTYLGAGHDTWQIVISLEWCFVRFPDDREGRGETPETANGQFGSAGDAASISNGYEQTG